MDKEIKGIKRHWEEMKRFPNNNPGYAFAVSDIEYLLNKIEKLEKVKEVAERVAWTNALGPVHNDEDFKIPTYFIHEVWINSLRQTLKESEGLNERMS